VHYETKTTIAIPAGPKGVFPMPRPFFLIFVLFLAILPIQSATPARGTELADKYAPWLDLTEYIITPVERRIFLQLTNERDRDAFIAFFWKQRDSSKATPENEYRDEHIKRFEYTKKYFGYTSPLPGWKTDRGRIYILLGPPVNRNEIFNSYLYPIEIWEYYGDPAKGLPTMFNVVFYRKGGAGDFKLYVPAQDGPDQLLVRQIGEISTFDYRAIYQKIYEIKPEVAEVALSLIPGEKTLNYSPSMRDVQLLAKIADLPSKHINTTYARQFLNYKAYVDIESSFDYLNSRHELILLRDPLLKMNFIHFAIWPERISVDYSDEKEKYYCSYNLVIDLKKGDRSIYQYTKNLPISYSKEEMEKNLANGLILADMFPVIDGDFDVSVFVQNAVNQEFCFFSEKISIPPADRWALFGPLVSYNINREPRLSRSAFSLLDMHVSPDPQRTFGQQEPLKVIFCIDRGHDTGAMVPEIEVSNLPSAGVAPFSRSFTPQAIGGGSLQVFTASLDQLPPGQYSLTVRVRDAAKIVRLSGEAIFSISRLLRLPHPPVAAPLLANEKTYVYDSMLAGQYENSSRAAEAEQAHLKSLAQAPGNAALIKTYVQFLFVQKKYEQIPGVLAPLQDQAQAAFDFYSLRGKAYYYLARYAEAVVDLLQANLSYDSDLSVLNTLGLSFLRLNNPAEARKVLAASLKINARQPDIADLLKQLEGPK
jgi:GWxTD domain-containing protein